MKRHEVKLKNSDDIMESKAEIEQDYLSAIKKKLQILGNFD